MEERGANLGLVLFDYVAQAHSRLWNVRGIKLRIRNFEFIKLSFVFGFSQKTLESSAAPEILEWYSVLSMVKS